MITKKKDLFIYNNIYNKLNNFLKTDKKDLLIYNNIYHKLNAMVLHISLHCASSFCYKSNLT